MAVCWHSATIDACDVQATILNGFYKQARREGDLDKANNYRDRIAELAQIAKKAQLQCQCIYNKGRPSSPWWSDTELESGERA